MENKEGFQYIYSASQQQEVEAIREKYLPKEEDKMAQLRKLHAIPTQKAQAASLAVGIIGALIMGTGMSLAMTEIGAALGGLATVRARIKEISDKGKDASVKEEKKLTNLLILNEMLSRGVELLPVDLEKSKAKQYTVEGDKIRIPFSSLDGIGESAARAMEAAVAEGEILSWDDLQSRAGVSKTVIEALAAMGTLNHIPKSMQMSLF